MKTIALLPLLFISFMSFSQAPEIEWQNTIGGNYEDQLHCLAPTTTGGYLLGGCSMSGISGDKNEISQGMYDYWIVKLDNEGSLGGQNTIGGNISDFLESVQQTSDGGSILGGYSNSDISGDKIEGSFGGTFDYWIVKLNSLGSIEWQNTIGGYGDDYLTSIKQTSDGGYILGGRSNSPLSGDKTESNIDASMDFWIIKLDNSGAIEWQNTIGGTGWDELVTIALTSDDGYILGGNSYSGISVDKTEACQGSYDYWIVKLNNSGTIEWQNTIGGSQNDMLSSVDNTIDGGYILGGYSLSGISGDKTEANIGEEDYWVIKLNEFGNIQWQNTIGGNLRDLLIDIDQSDDGGYILGGYSNSGISGDKNEANIGFYDFWIVKLHNSGILLWQNNIGGWTDEILYCVEECSDGGYLFGGSSNSPISGDKTEINIGYNDYWLVKLEAGCVPTAELCNSLDDNCNGLIDDAVTESISIVAGGPTTFCDGGSVVLTATYSGTSVNWKRNGTYIIGATSANYTATVKGTYTCETSSICDTELSSAILVTVNKLPTATITSGGSTTFCAGGSVVLTANAGGGLTYQWYKGGATLAGATMINYTATVAGTFRCKVTKTATGCNKVSNAIVVAVPCRDDQQINETNKMTVYPNPATNLLTIVDKSYIQNSSGILARISITGVTGNLIYSYFMSDGYLEIDILAFPRGIYFVTILSGEMQLTEKVVIQ